ncbi:MAG: hypothetical protein U0Z53_20195 [Blastocatellia bacterium]
MKSMLSFVVAACCLATFPPQESAPAKQTADGRYALEAILVLTPEQCSVKTKKGNLMVKTEKFDMKELLCPAAESAVQQVFEKYTRVETPPEKGSAPGRLILTPKLVDLEATMTATAFGKRKMVLLVEWTATDETGKVCWVQTVEGNAKEKMGNLFTGGKHQRKMLEAIRKDLADKSAQAMRQSGELQKLAQKAR